MKEQAPVKRSTLARAGFGDTEAAQPWLKDLVAYDWVDDLDQVVADLGGAADPNEALIGLVRIIENPEASEHLRSSLSDVGQSISGRKNLMRVLGLSQHLADFLARHPEAWIAAEKTIEFTLDERRAHLHHALDSDPDAPTPFSQLPPEAGLDQLRIGYFTQLVGIAMWDANHPRPTEIVDDISRRLSDLAAAALSGALAWSRAQLPDHGQGCSLAVIAMGKTGGQELNYISDVDVVYVVAARPGTEEQEAITVGTTLATLVNKACGQSTKEGSLWPVDANLRPEGKDGPLVRTLDSHLDYYSRWAKTWEFQALLKARPVAGDFDLGLAYFDAVQPLIFEAVSRTNFVSDVQQMRQRVERSIPGKTADRQLKLGVGGLRDVEFSVQLLQLVHGRSRPALNTGHTLQALRVLVDGGYIGREDGEELDQAYRFLRVLEHRMQLHRLRRSSVVPDSDRDLRRLARACGYKNADELEKQWRVTKQTVRHLHEMLFYRPLLTAVSKLSTEEARLDPAAARNRLHALGYSDPDAAWQHLASLTTGVTRRAAIQRQLLPVLLEWLADAADPDVGLLRFRRISESLGTTHWFLALLRDSDAAAERLARVLASSVYASDLLQRDPQAISWLDQKDGLLIRDRAAMSDRIAATLRRSQGPGQEFALIRAARRRELLRTALGDIVGVVAQEDVGTALSAHVGACLQGALDASISRTIAATASDQPADVAIIAMGRLGGAELNYGSDADVMFVHRARPGCNESDATAFATAVVKTLQRELKKPSVEPALLVDTGLRPEGSKGPLTRSLASYEQYYQRWSEPWEAQALLRAYPIAGDRELCEAFTDLIHPLRYPAGGLDPGQVRQMRRLKARMESERVPRGVDPRRHLKLGPGGLSDIEWTAQLVQLQYGSKHVQLQDTRTKPVLGAAAELGLLDTEAAHTLSETWEFLARLRNAMSLWTGRSIDVLPSGHTDLEGIGRLMHFAAPAAQDLENELLRRTRQARAIVEQWYFGDTSGHSHPDD